MKYIILILIPLLSIAQSDVPDKYWLDDSNFEKTVISSSAFDDDNTDTIVIEFWAKFNEANCLAEWEMIKDATYYRIDIAKAPNVKKEYRVRMAPTIIIFKDGVAEESFKAGLDLECPVDLEELQEAIEEVKTAGAF